MKNDVVPTVNLVCRECKRVTKVHVQHADPVCEHCGKVALYGLANLTISTLITLLERVKKSHGDLEVYYADGYDNALSVSCVEADKDPGWNGAPKYKALYLG